MGIMIFKQFGKSKMKPEAEALLDQSPPEGYSASSSSFITPNEIEQIPDGEFVKTDSDKENLDSKKPSEKES